MTEEQLIKLALTAAVEAGEKILEIYNSDDFGIETKDDDSPLTKADLRAHEVILEVLSKSNIPVLSEEGASIPFEERNKWEALWIVDPIDGTKEFIKRNGEFTVNIALIRNQIPVIGIVYVPVTGLLYWGAEGFGSFSYFTNEVDTLFSTAPAFQLPKSSDRTSYTVVASRSHLSPETSVFIAEKEKEHGEIISLSKGSSLKLCLVAEGAADCYPRFAPTMEWDTAAGHGVCKYAGCLVMDWETKKEMVYNREKLLNNWFLVERN